MYANQPEMAERWQKDTPMGMNLKPKIEAPGNPNPDKPAQKNPTKSSKPKSFSGKDGFNRFFRKVGRGK